jgi:hypothetical protein
MEQCIFYLYFAGSGGIRSHALIFLFRPFGFGGSAAKLYSVVVVQEEGIVEDRERVGNTGVVMVRSSTEDCNFSFYQQTGTGCPSCLSVRHQPFHHQTWYDPTMCRRTSCVFCQAHA